MRFEIDRQQQEKLAVWIAEQDRRIQEDQQKSEDENVRRLSQDGAYYGAIAGAYTFSFTPTTLGTALIVSNCVTKEEINLTDYDSW